MADDADPTDVELIAEETAPSNVATEVDDEPAEGSNCDDGGTADSATMASGRSRVRQCVAFGLAAAIVLSGLVGWLTYGAYRERNDEHQRAAFLEAGRQGALNLTTVSYTEAEADVARILDSATGKFRDDFQNRSQPFVDVVKKAQAKTVGTISDAGLESVNGEDAQVLVAVTVKTSNAGQPDQSPRQWRMRISVQQLGDTTKVSNVEFVP